MVVKYGLIVQRGRAHPSIFHCLYTSRWISKNKTMTTLITILLVIAGIIALLLIIGRFMKREHFNGRLPLARLKKPNFVYVSDFINSVERLPKKLIGWTDALEIAK